MNNAAAIQAQLVDIRNIGHDKCVKLTLHVPAEQAPLVLKAFGWPTAVDPVPVALARLTQPKENEAQPRPTSPTTTHPGGAHTKKSWPDMAPAQQAGILCADPAFAKFMEIQYGTLPEGGCAERVRIECHVGSRGDIKPGTRAAEIWSEIVSEYRTWMREPQVIPQ